MRLDLDSTCVCARLVTRQAPSGHIVLVILVLPRVVVHCTAAGGLPVTAPSTHNDPHTGEDDTRFAYSWYLLHAARHTHISEQVVRVHSWASSKSS